MVELSFLRQLLALWAVCAALGGGRAAGAPVREASPVAPRIPARSFRLLDYGATGDGRTLNTEAFRRAVEACSAAGGGTVRVPRGRFLTGPVALASCVQLRLERGAVILFPPDVGTDAEAGRGRRYLLSAANCHDLAIVGQGTIDGQGAAAWQLKRSTPNFVDNRPWLVGFDHCERVRVEGVTLTNSPMFHLVPHHCTDVTITGVRIQAPHNSPNTDGIDPSMCHTVRISRCRIDVGDDCIAIKAGRDDAAHPTGPCSDITIVGCTFLHGHGMSVGSETVGGLRRMIVRNCTFEDTGAGIRLKAARDRGGVVVDLVYSDIRMRRVNQAIQISSYYPKIPKADQPDPAQAIGPLTPIWRGILIRNVTSVEGGSAGFIIGVPEMPVADITLQNVRISAKTGLRLRNIRGLRMIDTQIAAGQGQSLLEEGNVEELDRSVPPPRQD